MKGSTHPKVNLSQTPQLTFTLSTPDVRAHIAPVVVPTPMPGLCTILLYFALLINFLGLYLVVS
jgi:hypothetical protein